MAEEGTGERGRGEGGGRRKGPERGGEEKGGPHDPLAWAPNVLIRPCWKDTCID